MNQEERIKMLDCVFSPRSGEKVLILVDTPHDNIKDTSKWVDRRKMAQEWFETFSILGKKGVFSVDILHYGATGMNNASLPKKVIDSASKYNILIAMTQFSATASLISSFSNEKYNIRAASMPGVTKEMEETALKADYSLVKKYVLSLEGMLNNSVGAEIIFSTDDSLYIDLRNRNAIADAGDCSISGQFINFPSGEACKAPYEGVNDEAKEFGDSKTEGIMPVAYEKEILKFVIKKNNIVEVLGKSSKAEEMRSFFAKNPSRTNIAELGLGCNPNAVISGNVLEDEKVGLHIAYGMSSHLGGKVTSDMHQDVCYSKGCPVEGTTLDLIHEDGSKTRIIQDAVLRYDLLK